MNYNVYVISAGRYDKLPFNQKQKDSYIFCVKNGEGELYRSKGCCKVYETGNLMDSRNFALDHAFKENNICVQLSDDIKKVVINKNFGEPKNVELDFAIKDIVSKFKSVKGVKLLGIPPTDNFFFANKIVSVNYLFTFEHYSNKGGAVDVRDDNEEQKNIMILKSKWGDKIRLNSKRKNEILI